MPEGFFGAFLLELGPALHLANLHPDVNNACLIRFKGDVFVQLEVTQSGKQLLVGADLGHVAVGRYRENIFEAALTVNGLPPPRYGTFAYSKQTDHLILFQLFPLKDLSAQKVADFLQPFIAKAQIWQETIAKHMIPTISPKGTGKTGSGMFGLTS